MAKARILLSVNTSWNVWNFRAGLVSALGESGYEVVIVAPPDDFSARLAELGCRHVPLYMDNKGTSVLRDARLVVAFWRVFRLERPDVFLGFTVKPNIYGSVAAQILGVPTINNIAGLGTAFIRRSWLTLVVKLLYRLSLARSRVVFFQNADDLQLFLSERMARPAQARFIPGSGINLKRFQPAQVSNPADHLTFLLVSRLLWDKGVGEFVEAAKVVQRARPGTKFQLLGFLDVSNRTSIPREIVEGWVSQGILEYLGSADDVRPFIARASCLVLPSYREGTPRSLLEGAAMAKPLIATDVPGCRAVVEHGVTGLLCRPRDADDLATQIIAMVNMSPEQRLLMGVAGRQKVQKEFDENLVVDSYLSAIAAILKCVRRTPSRVRAS